MTTFNSNTVILKNSKLIEAGAGTGKTFSIAILTLRLIIEKKIPIQKILLVTFTEAAAAELEDRVRKFVRLAYNYTNGIDIGDENQQIKNILGDQNTKAAAKPLLEKALLSLDETSIGTIHSFCQKTLNEFAFETGQIYGAEALRDLTEVITDEVNDYWRNNISVLEKDLLLVLGEAVYKVPFANEKYLSRKTLIELIKESLGGKVFYTDKNILVNEVQVKIKALENEIVEKQQLLSKNKNELIAKVENYSAKGFAQGSKDKLVLIIQNIEAFIDHLKKTTAQHTISIFQEERDWFLEKENERKSMPVKCINGLFQDAIKTIVPKIKDQIIAKNQWSFDDMIQNLHRAVCNLPNENLRTLLSNKFDAVFIDEFQDTDKYQYEIFNSLFGEDKILFYIGDPKQAIYSWRKADINTYFSAKAAVGEVQTMDTNYRSTKQLVMAFNDFFGADGLDAFSNDVNKNKINYFEVSPKLNASEITLKLSDKVLKPITIFDCYEEDKNLEPTKYTSKEKIVDSVSNLVISMLKNGMLGEKKVAPSNIAIIVRSNSEGRKFKKIFEQLNIPSILMFDEKIFNTDEANYVLYLLQAIAELSINNIKKALLTPFTGFTSLDIAKLNSDLHVEFFKSYSNTFQKDGVYACLSKFISDYKVREQLLKANMEGGQRVLSNLLQLAEVLQDEQQNKQLDLTELISFLKKGIDGIETEGDEYVQRLETDNESLKIVTIHKSKGLEYDIVIAPFLDLKVEKKFAFSSFRDANGEYKFATNDSLLGENLRSFEFQNGQENRRLIYVAITRARYQCFLFKQPVNNMRSLDPFYSAINENSEYISKEKYVFTNEQYITLDNNHTYNYPENINIELTDKNWSKMSFSFLGGKHASTSRNASTKEMRDYDKFIFQDLERGVNAGNLLHDIFEFIDFTDSESWQGVIERSLNKFLKKQKEEFKEPLLQMLQHILQVKIRIFEQDILLNNISNAQKVNEIEFDINMPAFSVGALNSLSDETRTIKSINAGVLYGVLNGLMDMFFEYDGKYYILDWKSNYLGDTLEDYAPDKLNEAMNENNYHLQYMIYTYAADRFLKARMAEYDYEKHFGGVIYLFIRGVRKDKDTGIFAHRPTREDMEKLDGIFKLY